MAKLAEVLPVGRENALTARELAELVGLPSIRKVSKAIEQLRREGVPVCASCNPAKPGYFVADGPAELNLYIKSLRRRIREVSATAGCLSDALSEMIGQEKIVGW